MIHAIAIDGPAGAGKSTIAKLVAKKLGIVYVDTGAMYRAIGLYMINHGIEKSDIEAVKKGLSDIAIDIKYINGSQHVLLNGDDVSDKIRTEEVSRAASDFAVIPEVRKGLTELQRNLAKKTAVVMDGRDIGTVVLPDASAKIYLTASAHVRAERRYKEQIAKGLSVNISDIEADIIKRDEQDKNRAVAPLKQADDAVLVDSSDMTIDDAAFAILSEAAKRDSSFAVS